VTLSATTLLRVVVINAHACHAAYHHRADDHGALYLALNTATIVIELPIVLRLLFFMLIRRTGVLLGDRVSRKQRPPAVGNPCATCVFSCHRGSLSLACISFHGPAWHEKFILGQGKILCFSYTRDLMPTSSSGMLFRGCVMCCCRSQVLEAAPKLSWLRPATSGWRQ
jgi:hypothetical protein